jgi:hypothetical protein
MVKIYWGKQSPKIRINKRKNKIITTHSILIHEKMIHSYHLLNYSSVHSKISHFYSIILIYQQNQPKILTISQVTPFLTGPFYANAPDIESLRSDTVPQILTVSPPFHAGFWMFILSNVLKQVFLEVFESFWTFDSLNVESVPFERILALFQLH